VARAELAGWLIAETEMLEQPRKEITSMQVAALARVAKQWGWVVDRDLLIKAVSPGML